MERIINFFQTEVMQNRLANVLLNDAGLQEDLNLDTPDNPDYNPEEGLNYLTVAKVGILTFADYIHDIYIADGGWREQTWNWIFDPGYTLVDLVNDIFSVAANAVTIIKAGVTSVMNAVKSGMEFIVDQVITLIIDGFVNIIDSLLKIVSEIINLSNLGVSSTFANNELLIENERIYVGRENHNIKIEVNEMKILVSNVYFLPSLDRLETLSLQETHQTMELVTWISTSIAMILLAFDHVSAAKLFFVPLTTTVIAKILDYPDQDPNEYIYSMFWFHFSSATGFILSLIIDDKFNDVTSFILLNIFGIGTGYLISDDNLSFSAISLGFLINLLGIAASSLGKLSGISIAYAINLFLLIYNLIFSIVYFTLCMLNGVDLFE